MVRLVLFVVLFCTKVFLGLISFLKLRSCLDRNGANLNEIEKVNFESFSPPVKLKTFILRFEISAREKLYFQGKKV